MSQSPPRPDMTDEEYEASMASFEASLPPTAQAALAAAFDAGEKARRVFKRLAPDASSTPPSDPLADLDAAHRAAQDAARETLHAEAELGKLEAAQDDDATASVMDALHRTVQRFEDSSAVLRRAMDDFGSEGPEGEEREAGERRGEGVERQEQQQGERLIGRSWVRARQEEIEGADEVDEVEQDKPLSDPHVVNPIAKE